MATGEGVIGNLGLGGNGENWTGGRLNGDEVRLVKDAEGFDCILTGEVVPFLAAAGLSCIDDERARRDFLG